ncbi:MAG TPA: hypothetical protein VGM23_09545, partial [Armatimonadota bacterium]
MFFGESGGLYLRMEDPARHPRGLTTFHCIGWDMQPRWRIATYYDGSFVREVIGPEESHLRSTILSLSPDGRVFALAEADRKAIRVTSWRNGRLRGQVLLPWPAASAGFYRRMQATNSGRIWIYDSALWTTACCQFWAIDGDKVIGGSYTTSFPIGNDLTKCTLSPGGMGLLCYQLVGAYLDYVTLITHGDQVRTVRRYTLSKGGEEVHWLDEESALSPAHTLIGPAGVLKRAPWEALRFSPPHERSWAIAT